MAWMPEMAAKLAVRYLETMRLGTFYPDVVARVCEIMRDPRLDGQNHLVVDATGVGACDGSAAAGGDAREDDGGGHHGWGSCA